MKLKAQFRVSSQKDKIQRMEAKWTLTHFRLLLIIQKIRQLILFFDDYSWCFLSETSKLASNSASFSFVVNVDWVKTLDEE